jgi:hypothetical protein
VENWIEFRSGSEPYPLDDGTYEAEIESLVGRRAERRVVEQAKLVRSDREWRFENGLRMANFQSILRVRPLADPPG